MIASSEISTETVMSAWMAFFPYNRKQRTTFLNFLSGKDEPLKLNG